MFPCLSLLENGPKKFYKNGSIKGLLQLWSYLFQYNVADNVQILSFLERRSWGRKKESAWMVGKVR